MKLSFNLSAADLNTIIFALGILPELELEDTPEQADINQLCCVSAVHKITSGNTKLTAKDFTVSEIKMVKKYRLLDAHGKDMVDMVLEKELERTETVSEDEDSEYMELVARGGKYRVKKADVIKWVKQLDLDDYEEDHDLC